MLDRLLEVSGLHRLLELSELDRLLEVSGFLEVSGLLEVLGHLEMAGLDRLLEMAGLDRLLEVLAIYVCRSSEFFSISCTAYPFQLCLCNGRAIPPLVC